MVFNFSQLKHIYPSGWRIFIYISSSWNISFHNIIDNYYFNIYRRSFSSISYKGTTHSWINKKKIYVHFFLSDWKLNDQSYSFIYFLFLRKYFYKSCCFIFHILGIAWKIFTTVVWTLHTFLFLKEWFIF